MLDIPICPIYPFVPTSHPIYFVTMVITNSYCVIHQRHQTNCQMLSPNTQLSVNAAMEYNWSFLSLSFIYRKIRAIFVLPMDYRDCIFLILYVLFISVLSKTYAQNGSFLQSIKEIFNREKQKFFIVVFTYTHTEKLLVLMTLKLFL